MWPRRPPNRGLHNGGMSEHEARLLVFGGRDEAETAAEQLPELLPGLAGPPRVVREALAGEDDAEDAQWLVALEPPEGGWRARQLDVLAELAAEHDGWVETA